MHIVYHSNRQIVMMKVHVSADVYYLYIAYYNNTAFITVRSCVVLTSCKALTVSSDTASATEEALEIGL